MSAGLSDATVRVGQFATTRWTIIRGDTESQVATSNALSELCIYWRPIYLFLRRQGISSHDA